MRKGCAGRFKVAIFPQFLTSNVHFVRKGCAGHLKVAIFPQFLTSNVQADCETLGSDCEIEIVKSGRQIVKIWGEIVKLVL